MKTAISSVRDPVSFISAYIKVNELGRPFHLFPHQKEVLRLAFQFDESGRLPYDTIIYSCPKKSGKTTINAAVTCWWAFTQEAPNELLILANDLEQAQARVFKTLVALIEKNPQLASSAKTQMKQVAFSNGSVTTALANEYRGDAGSNHGETSWDELWAYDSEADLRLWEELTPVPTRTNSLRFITTYSGFENESSLLRGLYLLGVGKDEHPDGQGERLHPTLPIYGNREARVLCSWDHEPRLPWQTEGYRAAQRRVLRPNTYLRLHENRWTSAESSFIAADAYDACVDLAHHPLLPTQEVEVFVGVDGSTKHDTAAVVGVVRTAACVRLAFHRIWKPSPSEPLDLEATIEAYLHDLHAHFSLRRVVADPFQLHRSIMTLRAAGVPIEDFPQTVANTTRMGQTLYDLLKGRTLVLYPDDELRAHTLNAIAVETPRGFRIAKEKASKKIDGCVALSMACVAALDQPVFGPFVFSCNGVSIGAGTAPPASSPVAVQPEPVRPVGAELLGVPAHARKLLTPEELEQRAELVAQAQRRDSPVEQACRRVGHWWPRT